MEPLISFFLFLKGCLVGLSVAVPVGPVAVLCIKRTLLHGRRAGLISGLGAATADLLYGLIAALGLTALAETLFGFVQWLELVGALLLFFLGTRALLKKEPSLELPLRPSSPLKAFSSSFFLTLTNPLTLVAFLGIFSALGWGELEEGPYGSLFILLGVFSGASLWWFLLSEGIYLFRNLLPRHLFRRVNQVAGTLLIFFGLLLLSTSLYTFSL